MKQGKKTVLVVDDDETVLKSISKYLASKGYGVETATTGREAVEKSNKCFINLAILDIRLPDMDGTELLTRMIETEPKMKKIMLTGYPSVENAAESVNKQADAYILKPVDLKKLFRVIEQKLVEQEQELKMDRKRLITYIKSRDKEQGDT
ncbi:MAG: response regulator [Candidatus Bathyarchaeia archaeon]